MKITFEILPSRIAEPQVLQKLKDDWGYTRKPRDDPSRNLTFIAPIREYYIAIILTPEKYKGRIAGYCGVGLFDDLMTDSGAYTLGGDALEISEKVVDLRGNGVYSALRSHRNNIVEKEANSKGMPFLVLLGLTSTAHDYYEGRGYVPKSENIPQWALDKVKDKGKIWYVYNLNDKIDKSFDKIWNSIIKSSNFEVKTNFPDADFWIRRVHGDREKVGEVLEEFHKGYIGVKVLATDKILPNYMFYAMQQPKIQQWFSHIANGSVQQFITVKDVKDVLDRFVVGE